MTLSMTLKRVARISANLGDIRDIASCSSPVISADGRYVTFYSQGTHSTTPDRMIGESIHLGGIFMYDRQTNKTTCVSLDSDSVQSNGYPYAPAVSADGRYAAFTIQGTRPLDGELYISNQSLIHDRQTNTIENLPGSDTSVFLAFSADGRYVGYDCQSHSDQERSNFSFPNVFVYDRHTKAMDCISLDANGIEGNAPSYIHSISADGQYVIFESRATNLVETEGYTGGWSRIFVGDRHTKTLNLLAIDLPDVHGGVSFHGVSISADQRFVAGISTVTEYMPGHDIYDLGKQQISTTFFMYDLQMKTTNTIPLDSGSVFSASSISADGRYVTFSSTAGDRAERHNNGSSDILIYENLFAVGEQRHEKEERDRPYKNVTKTARVEPLSRRSLQWLLKMIDTLRSLVLPTS